MIDLRNFFSNVVSYFIDSLWEDEYMQFRQPKNVVKSENKKIHLDKDHQSESIEIHSKMATNVVHFPRKTNMGKCKRGHSIG